MKAAELCVVFVVVGTLLLPGCNGKVPMGHLGSAATQPPPPGADPARPATPTYSTPYVLAAECAGPYITFTVANMGNIDLPVKKEDFALVVPGKKQVIPYDKQTDIIDLPPDTVVPPQKIITGRAKFKQSPAPVGNRLVFKPDHIGTYADIQTQVSQNAKNPGGSSATVTR